MTSGNFQSTPVDSITIIRDDRQRRELTNIPELAESISRSGLIHPIVITRDLVLVAGERRLTAVKSLGWTSIMTQFADDLSELELQIIELEENVRRVDLPWDEQCAAIEKFHSLRTQQEPEHTVTETAKELGLSIPETTERIAVATAMKNSELVRDAPKYSTARNIVRREQARRVSSIKLDTDMLADVVPTDTPVRRVPLINEDFIEWSNAYTGQPFNFLHCDFPYGVNMHKSGQGANAEYGSYADEADVYWRLLSQLAIAMDNVVADSAHLMFWFSMDFYHVTVERLTAMGWRVNPFPLVWIKSDNTGIIPDPQRGPRRIYETCLFASRGDRLLTPRGPKANAFAFAGKDKSIHMNEKPVPMLQHFMSMFVDEYSFVLDPTCGSGNAVKAAQGLGAGKVLGIERDPEFFARSYESFFEGE